MPIRITGLNSGLDTESIISALVSSYNYKTQKYEKAQTKLSWKQDAWKELNTKIYSLYKNVGNLKLSSAYNLKSATVSDSSIVSVKAGANAINGSYSVQVTDLAKSGYLTGAKVKDDTKSTTTLGELGYRGSSATISLEVGTTQKNITLKQTSTVSDVLKELKDAGVNASFDEANGRFFISSKKSGAANDFKLTAESDAGKEILNALGLNTEASVDAEDYEALAKYAGIKETDVKAIQTAINAGDDTALESYKANYGEDIVEAVNGLSDDTAIQNFVKAANGEYVEGATYVKGSDAVIYVNGAQYTGDSNTFSINGMTITATGVTGEYNPYDVGAVTVGVNTDTQAIYDKVKDFLTQYNALINEMTSLYNADSAKGYEPLTDEEKDAMSETEVEKWEEKIKASLLRRDDTLSGIISTMTNAMSKTYQINGKTYSLSSFGIQTLGFLNAAENEQNAYHIDGDEDDVNTSGKTDKLMAAIADDPDTVINFMKELTTGLYNAIDTKMKSTTLSSVYTVYNDKEMASEYSDYTSLITKWQERLEQQEEYYYNKFAQMESALAELNSQSSSLSGLFGM